MFRTDADARAVYSEAAGIGRILPRAVAVPAAAGDVPAIVRWAAEHELPITARGSGSSMANGAIGGGVILDLSRLGEIGPVDRAAASVRCGAGAIRDTLDGAARAHGLRLPVDPSSGAFCTIGGMIATNAAGAHSLAFGSMRAWVAAVDVVFADGSSATLRRGDPPPAGLAPVTRALAVLERCRENAAVFRRGVRKDSSGYGVGAWLESGDLLDVIVGSEGTLAIVTGAELRLAPVPPASSSLLAAFNDLHHTAAGAAAAREHGATVCELLERTFLDLARGNGRLRGVPAAAAAVLLVQVEGDAEQEVQSRCAGLDRTLREAGAIHSAVAMLPAEAREIWELRHAASPALARLDPALSSVQVIEDGAVPPERLAEYVAGVQRALDHAAIRGVIFGHAGDAHVHVNPLVDFGAPDWRERLDGLLEEATALVAGLGGTLTGEHGDGRLRAPLLARTWNAAAIDAFAGLKRAFDPQGILNPGVKLPLAGQLPIEQVKYDPAPTPLPATARRALDTVTRDRAYSTSRLSLLDGAV